MTYAPEAAGVQRADAVEITPDGRTAVLTGATAGTMGIVGYDVATGAQRWATRVGSGDAAGADVVVTPDGARAVAVGSAAGDWLVAAVDTNTGARAWTRTFDLAGRSDVAVGAVAVADVVVVAGYSSAGLAANGVDQYDVALVAFDAATGERRWVATYDGPANFWDIATGIAAGHVDGRDVVVATARSNGASAGNDDTDIATVAYDAADGAPRWVTRTDGGGRDYPYAVAIGGGRVVVAAEAAGGAGFDYFTAAYDLADGATAWTARYDGAGFDDRALAVAATADGATAIVTGFSANQSLVADRDAATVAYDLATGARRWVTRLKDTAGAAASAVALSPDGRRAYVAGVRGGLVFGVGVNALGVAAAYSGFLTIALDAGTGATVWTGDYGGAGNDDAARALAVSRDGASVVVTGGGARWATLGYDG